MISRFDVVRIATDVMEERGYIGNFNVGYISDRIIVIVMTIGDLNINKVLLMDDIKLYEDPKHMVRYTINEMINQIRRNNND